MKTRNKQIGWKKISGISNSTERVRIIQISERGQERYWLEK